MCSHKLDLSIGTEVHFLFRNRDTGVYSTEVCHNPEKNNIFYLVLYFTLVCLLIDQQILIEIDFFWGVFWRNRFLHEKKKKRLYRVMQ